MSVVLCCFFFSSRRRHTRFDCDWSSDVCSSDLGDGARFCLVSRWKDNRILFRRRRGVCAPYPRPEWNRRGEEDQPRNRLLLLSSLVARQQKDRLSRQPPQRLVRRRGTEEARQNRS